MQPRGRQSARDLRPPPVATLPAAAVFRKYAVAGGGQPEINKMHVQEALVDMGIDVHAAQLDKTLARVGAEGAHSITFEDFERVVGVHQQDRYTVEQVRELLQTFDSNGDGVLNSAEFRRIWRKRMTETEIAETMIAADCNMDGNVDFEEFVRLMCPELLEGAARLRAASPPPDDGVDEAATAAFTAASRDTDDALRHREKCTALAANSGVATRLRRLERLRSEYLAALAQDFKGIRTVCEEIIAALQCDGESLEAELQGPVRREVAQQVAAAHVSPVTVRSAKAAPGLMRCRQWAALTAQRHSLMPPGLVPFPHGSGWQQDGKACEAVAKQWRQDEPERAKLRAAYVAGFCGEPTPGGSVAERAANALGLRRQLNGNALVLADDATLSLDPRQKGQAALSGGIWVNGGLIEGAGADSAPIRTAEYLRGASLCDMLGVELLPLSAAADEGSAVLWMSCSGTLHSTSEKTAGGRPSATAAALPRTCAFQMDGPQKHYSLGSASTVAEAEADIRFSDDSGWAQIVSVALVMSAADAERVTAALRAIRAELANGKLDASADGHHIQGFLGEASVRRLAQMVADTRQHHLWGHPEPEMMLDMVAGREGIGSDEAEGMAQMRREWARLEASLQQSAQEARRQREQMEGDEGAARRVLVEKEEETEWEQLMSRLRTEKPKPAPASPPPASPPPAPAPAPKAPPPPKAAEKKKGCC